jgi:hypothetical protein
MTTVPQYIDLIEADEDGEGYIKEFERISKQNMDDMKVPKPACVDLRQKFDSADYMMKHNKEKIINR